MVVGSARLRGVLEREEGPRLWRDRRGPLAYAGADRSCATTVGGSDVEGRGRPVAVGGDAVPGVRWGAGAVGRLSAAGAGQPGEVQAAGQAGALQGLRAHARAAAWVLAGAPAGRGRRGRVRAGDGGRGPGVSPDRRGAGVGGDDGALVVRRLRARADVLRGWFVALAVEMAEPPPRPPPGCSALGLLVRAIADAFLAARLRLGPGAVRGGVWAFCSAATTGGLLANTSVL